VTTRVGRVAVIGGGITGLSAAWELTRGAARPAITIFESGRIGGKLQSSPFAGIDHVDEAADAFLARVPWGRQLCSDLGITDLVSPVTGRAYVWHGKRLHPIPDGLVLGVPAGLGGLLKSRLLSPMGVARAGLDLLIPSTPPDHDSLGRLIRDRFGHEVLERLVDPLVGSINAGDADTLSLDASVPQIAEPARSGRSLLRSLSKSRPAPSDAPIFVTPRKGLGWMAATLAERLRGLEVDFRTGHAVDSVSRDGAKWRVNGELFDAVVLTTPADVAARLLRSASPDAAKALIGIPYAGVVMVGLHVERPVGPIGSGYLVPKPVQRHVTAASLSSYKWAHWAPSTGGAVLRVSLGRYGNQAALDFSDDEALRVAVDEVSEHLGTPIEPVGHRITRWPRSFPQYLPHHLDRVASIENAVRRDCPGLVLAGAAYRGVGVPACIRQGREAARAIG
jgi:oxygen-dependent protoporphyrinogen oxidase